MSFDRQPEVIEALIGVTAADVDAVAGGDRRDEHVGAAELDARCARGRANDFTAQNIVQPKSRSLRDSGLRKWTWSQVTVGILGFPSITIGAELEPGFGVNLAAVSAIPSPEPLRHRRRNIVWVTCNLAHPEWLKMQRRNVQRQSSKSSYGVPPVGLFSCAAATPWPRIEGAAMRIAGRSFGGAEARLIV